MKKCTPFTIGIVLFHATAFSSCSALSGTFMDGTDFGILVVLAAIAVNLFFIVKAKKNKI